MSPHDSWATEQLDGGSSVERIQLSFVQFQRVNMAAPIGPEG